MASETPNMFNERARVARTKRRAATKQRAAMKSAPIKPTSEKSWT